METININQFLEIVQNSKGQIEVHEYDGKSIFSITSVSARKLLYYLEVPKEVNGYEFIYKELIKKFDGKYQKYCLGDMHQHWVTLMIGKAIVSLKYSLTDGQNFLFGLSQENS